MADDILKAYLVSIGFKVDEADYKRFKDSQLETEKRTKDLSKAFSDFAKVGIGAAGVLGGMVLKVSSSLENLHFQAQKSGTSAQNLKAFGDAAAQIGIQAEDAMGIVQQFNNKIRDNPVGMGALLGNLGVNENQDKTKVLLDLVDKLAAISGPNADVQRVAYAAQFGIGGEDIRTLIRGREELHKYYEERKLVYGDIDQQSLAAHKANEEFRNLEARFSTLTNAIGVSFLPVAKDVVAVLETIAKDLVEADKATDGWSSRLIGLATAIGTTVGGLKALGILKGLGGGGATAGGSAALGVAGAGILGGALANWGINIKADENDIKARRDWDEVANANRSEQSMAALFKKETGKDRLENPREYAAWFAGKIKSRRSAAMTFASPNTYSESFLSRHPAFRIGGGEDTSVKGLIDKYAGKYGIDPALLEAQAYQESHLSQKAISPKGAIGVMQLMPATARGLGVDPYNLEANIEGGARMMAGLLKKYHGDTSLALAAYNAGEGAVDRAHGIPRIAETQDYVASIQRRMASEAAGNRVTVKMDQKTDVNVYGSGDAAKAADLVAKNQEKVNAGLARDFAGAVQ